MKKITKKKAKDILQRYIEAKTEKNKLDRELKELKAVIEEQQLQADGFRVKFIECERENLSLKELREYLTEKQLEKYIDPYTTTITFIRLDVKEEEAA